MSQDKIKLSDNLLLPIRLYDSNTGRFHVGDDLCQNFYAIRIYDEYNHKTLWYPTSYLTLSSCKKKFNKIEMLYKQYGYKLWIEPCYINHDK